MKQKKFSAGAVSQLEFVHALHYVATKIRWAYQSILHFFTLFLNFMQSVYFVKGLRLHTRRVGLRLLLLVVSLIRSGLLYKTLFKRVNHFLSQGLTNVAFWRLYYGNLVYELISSLIGQLKCSRFLLHNNHTQFIQRSKSLQLIL